jgi:predicted ATP-grasp superfamily ATP-dependent carboligase
MVGHLSRRTGTADQRPPTLIVKIGRYPLHHGAVAAARSLGRLGVPVYALAEDRFAPLALSRYVRKPFLWRTSGAEHPDVLIDGIRRIGERLDGPAVALATDDEAAVLLAARRAELSDVFLLPPIEPALPVLLADKQGLHELCRTHAVPSPETVTVCSAEELRAAVDRLGLPVVVKNPAPWSRLVAPVVAGTTTLRSAADVSSAEQALRTTPQGRLLVQEYLPAPEGGRTGNRVGAAADWIAHLYRPIGDGAPLVFTGIKLRSWPAGGGVTTRGIAAPHPELAAMTAGFCRAIGFRGVADLDWRRDHRDGRLKLVDFNPRVGAQFQLFRTTTGVDVVRALYLDLTGHAVPQGAQIDGRELVVEHLDALAAVNARLHHRPGAAAWHGSFPRPVRRETAWLAWDDPLPFAAATTRFASAGFGRLAGLAARR